MSDRTPFDPVLNAGLVFDDSASTPIRASIAVRDGVVVSTRDQRASLREV